MERKKQKKLDLHIKDNFLCETIKKDQKGVLQEPECKLHHENKLFWKTVKSSFSGMNAN